MPEHFRIEGASLPRSTLIDRGNPIVLPMRRIQRSRRKGAPLPEGAKWVGPRSLFSNPLQGRRWGHAKSVILFRRWLPGQLGALSLERMGFCPGEIDALERRRCAIHSRLHELAGKDVACWCPVTSEWCHADSYLPLAPVYAEYDRLCA